jgi:hypothetical protein
MPNPIDHRTSGVGGNACSAVHHTNRATPIKTTPTAAANARTHRRDISNPLLFTNSIQPPFIRTRTAATPSAPGRLVPAAQVRHGRRPPRHGPARQLTLAVVHGMN